MGGPVDAARQPQCDHKTRAARAMLPIRDILAVYRPARPTGLCDPGHGHLDRLAGGKRALRLRGRKLGAYDADEDIELKAVRQQQGIGAAVIACGQQFHPLAGV
jgi:hypothetical protein